MMFLDVLAHVAGFGQRGGVGHHEGNVEQAGQRLGEQRLAEPVGPMSRMLLFDSSTSPAFLAEWRRRL